MTVSAIRLAGRPGLPLLVVGPSLGTSALTLWSAVAAELGNDFDVLGWDLPGHGANQWTPDAPVTIADLAHAVLAAIDELTDTPRAPTFHYAGDFIGGAVGLQLLLDAPGRVATATLLCTAARIETAEDWRPRQQAVAAGCTATLVNALPDIDDAGYDAVCGALAAFDVRDRLTEIVTPVLAVAGSDDSVTPPAALAHIALGVQHGDFVTLPGVGHLAPVEAPTDVARLIRRHSFGSDRDSQRRSEIRATGTTVRREVLGDSHVDRVTAAATDFTREFQEFITEYAWGGIWTRPGLDLRARSLITLTALVARGHHEELAMHIRAARTNGVSVGEIKELILQSAIYCGVPDANTAFRIAQATLTALGEA